MSIVRACRELLDSASLSSKKKELLLAFFGSFVVLFSIDLIIWASFDSAVNSGMVFGTMPYNFLAIVLSLVLLVLLFLFAPKNTEKDYIILSACGGAVVSNVVERIFFGGVVDYVPLLAGIRFNLADLVIVVTIVLIFWRKMTN